MATQLQLRRGTTSETGSFTGAVGEVSVDTTKDTLVVHDGSTAGGFEMAKADGSNMTAIDVGDNVQLKLGASDDLQIYHDGSDSYIKENGTGNLIVAADDFRVTNVAVSEVMISADTDGAVTLYNNGSPKIATTSGGVDVTGTATMDGLTVGSNVGIGTTSPNSYANLTTLTVNGTNGSVADFEVNGALTGEIFAQPNSLKIDAVGSSGVLKLLTNSTEALSIDSSQNVSIPNGDLLVGTTDTTPYNNNANSTADNGIVAGEAGLFTAARYQGSVGLFNRTGSDGEILGFKRSGADVGSIGVSSGNMYIQGNPATGKSGLTFFGSYIEPRDNGSPADNVIDLGSSSNRFKDLYLSSGVYLGGTGTANKLDDYEEGTFTATLQGGTSAPSTLITALSAKYTKVGNRVHFAIGFENIDTTGYAGGMSVTGLPFTNSGPRAVGNVIHFTTTTWTAGQLPVTIIGTGQATIECLVQISNSAWATSQHNPGSGRYMWLTGAYETA